MVRRVLRCAAVCCTAAAIAVVAADSFASAFPSQAARAGSSQVEPCGLLTPGDVAKATGIAVKEGVPGRPVPGVIGRCVWPGADNTRVVVTLTDAAHAKATMAAQAGAGGEAVSGIGSSAVAFPNAPVVGGYMVTVVDGKGGFGISIQGKPGTKARAIALAKIVAARR
jgi:hypothetical protein